MKIIRPHHGRSNNNLSWRDGWLLILAVLAIAAAALLNVIIR